MSEKRSRGFPTGSTEARKYRRIYGTLDTAPSTQVSLSPVLAPGHPARHPPTRNRKPGSGDHQWTVRALGGYPSDRP